MAMVGFGFRSNECGFNREPWRRLRNRCRNLAVHDEGDFLGGQRLPSIPSAVKPEIRFRHAPGHVSGSVKYAAWP